MTFINSDNKQSNYMNYSKFYVSPLYLVLVIFFAFQLHSSLAEKNVFQDRKTKISKEDLIGTWELNAVKEIESGKVISEDEFRGTLKQECCNFESVWTFKENNVLVVNRTTGIKKARYKLNNENFLVFTGIESGESKGKRPIVKYAKNKMIIDLDYGREDDKYYYVFYKQEK